MNRIAVVSEDDAINAQARTYAEYRVFAVLARHARNVCRVRVVLQQADAGDTCDEVACAVTVTLEPSGVLRIRATGPHVYAAINRAVDRLSRRLGRLVERRLSS
jgi:ribosomal subunit interface protein